MIFLIVSLLSINSASAQERITMLAGVGIPDVYHASARYRIDQLQLGVDLGYFHSKEFECKSAAADIFLHYSGTSHYSELKPWYCRIGAGYYTKDATDRTHELVFLDFRLLGRDVHFTRHWGMSFNAGFMFPLYQKETRDFEYDYKTEYTLIPTCQIALFLRF